MDTEDVEGWLVEEGIGFFDESGQFQYGVSTEEHEYVDFLSDLAGAGDPPLAGGPR